MQGNAIIGGVDKNEPLALVCIACRFAGGVDGAESLWRLLCDAEIPFVDVPEERWSLAMHHDTDPEAAGKTFVRQGGFLTQKIDRFDAPFFGILPREAESLDPQQRLLLECSWEAFEDGGIPPETLAGSNAGVYVGVFTLDGMVNQVSPLSRHLISPNTATGISATMVSNRLSYFYDLRGPNFSIDTACSSSLVAFHYACQDLWQGRTDMALVGGVNVMLRPEYPIAMAKGGFLSPDARCKSFDSRANGYARGEGAALVVIRPLSAALAAGQSVYALVLGTGVNQDGHTMGITVPNYESQRTLIEEVYESHGLDPLKTVYVEAHGTGTPVGDPIEARAIGEVIGKAGGRRSQPVFLGSLKANIGHTEAVAGVAGVIKAALCLDRQATPPQANLIEPNPDIPFEALKLKLPRTVEPLPGDVSCAQASVNSFGYGGTNAHAVLAAGPTPQSVDVDEPEAGRLFLTPLSARSPEALRQFARNCADRFSEPEVPLNGLRRSLAFRRSHHPIRMTVTAADREELVARLHAFGNDEDAVLGVVHGRIQRAAMQRPVMQRPVFVFTGMGPQWWGMGRELMASEPVFRTKAEEVDAIFRRIAGWSILKEMDRDEATSQISSNQYAQPGNFVVQVALAALWASWGIEPSSIVGHSVGEVSAAHVAGALSLEDATLVSFVRSQAQQRAAGKGKMLALGMGAEDARALVRTRSGRIEIAAVNSPASCTLAGDSDAIEEVAAELSGTVFVRVLTVEVAYHSHHMEPLENRIRKPLADIQPQAPQVPLYSTVTGHLVEGTVHNAEYWWRNVRQPVLFANAMVAMAEDGHNLFIEVGPHPVLKSSILSSAAEAQVKPTVLKSLDRNQPERATMLATIGQLYAMGYPVDWSRFIPEGKGFVRFPRYPWQREVYWLESEANRVDRVGWSGHPLLGRRLPQPTPTWETEINHAVMPWIDDHVIDGTRLLPGAAFVEAALEAGRQLSGNRLGAVAGVRLRKALFIPARTAVRMRVEIDPKHRRFSIHSRPLREGAEWTLHADGRLNRASDAAAKLDIEARKARMGRPEDGASFYRRLAEHGLTYGPMFQSVRTLWSGGGEVFARMELHEAIDPALGEFGLHPSLLDAAFQMMIGALDAGGGAGAYVPVELGRVAMIGEPGRAVWALGTVTRATPMFVEGDIILADEQGRVVAKVDGLRCQSVQRTDPLHEHLASWLYRYRWEPMEEPVSGSSWDSFDSWLVLADSGGLGEGVATLLAHSNQSVIIAHADPAASGLVRVDTKSFRLRLDSKEDMLQLLNVAKETGLTSVLYCWGTDADAEDSDGTGRCIALMHLMQAMRDAEILPRLVVMTRGSQAVLEGDRPSPGQAAVWGLARVILNEIPEVRVRSIDLAADGCASAEALDLAMAEIEEDELALRAGCVYQHRLVHLEIPDENGLAPMVKASEAVFTADPPLPTGQNDLTLRSARLLPLAASEVRIRLMSVTLVQNADGIAEACGIVEEVGKDVGNFAVGDVVVPLLSVPGLGSHVTVDREMVERVPARIGGVLERIAIGTQWLSCLTGLIASEEVAQLSADDTVFFPMGGFGWEVPAVRWAQRAGAKVLAATDDADTAALLERWGVKVLDAAAVDLEQQVREVSGGKVDAVLCSASGEALETCLTLLAPFGRVVRVFPSTGKIEDEDLPLGLLPANGRLATLDVLAFLRERPEELRPALARIWCGFEEGWLSSTPVADHAIGEIGKILSATVRSDAPTELCVAMAQGDVTLLPGRFVRQPFRKDGSYLVTGGFGGFGAAFARWMAEMGAGCLVLVGRKGAATNEAKALIGEIESLGTRVVGYACDVSDGAAVALMLRELRGTVPPLRGVIHAATVFDDRFVLGMDAVGFRNVMAPKALGALNLHDQTLDDSIEIFLNFSSVSALIGKPGQCNYVAANAVLDALAWRRRAEGLPALSVNWGVIGGVGVAARNDELREHLARQGIRAMPYRQCMDLIPYLMDFDPVQVGVMDVDWHANLGFLPSPRLSYLMGGAEEVLTEQVRTLRAATPSERVALVQAMLTKEVSETLRLPEDNILPDVALSALGVDSLAAVDLQTVIRIVFGVNVSQLEIVTSDGVAHIATIVLGRLNCKAEEVPEEMVV